MLIEKDDAAAIQVGTKVTLIKWGNCTITKRLEENGQVHLFGTVDEADKDFKGTAKIHWIANEPSCTTKVKIVEFDHLITEPKIEEDTKVEDIVNHNSKVEYTAIAEGCLRTLQKGDIFQFERRGFYFVDQVELFGKPMIVHFVPDGKQKAMSKVSHQVDAATVAKGKNAQEKQKAKQTTEGGEISKNAAKKAAKKAEKKAGGKPEGQQNQANPKVSAMLLMFAETAE